MFHRRITFPSYVLGLELGLAWTFPTALFSDKLFYCVCKIKVVSCSTISCFTGKVNRNGVDQFLLLW